MNSILYERDRVCPSKVVCVGRNYVEHIEELGNELPEQIVLFMKPNSAICTTIQLVEEEDLQYEAEITFLIKRGKIDGVGLGLDLTKRDLQSQLKARGLPWERAKSFDNSAVFGDFVSFEGELSQLRLELYINDGLRQSGGCSMMLHQPDAILHEVQSTISLEDGDLVMTGTPKGVGPVIAGDEFVGKIYAGETLLVDNYWKV